MYMNITGDGWMADYQFYVLFNIILRLTREPEVLGSLFLIVIQKG